MSRGDIVHLHLEYTLGAVHDSEQGGATITIRRGPGVHARIPCSPAPVTPLPRGFCTNVHLGQCQDLTAALPGMPHAGPFPCTDGPPVECQTAAHQPTDD